MGRYTTRVKEETLINKVTCVVKDIYKHNPEAIFIEIKADVLSIPKMEVSYTASIMEKDEEEETESADG